MKKVKTPHDAKGSRNLKTRPITTSDAVNTGIPAKTVRNVPRGHVIHGIRDINRIGWETWEQAVAEMLRMLEEQRLDRANRFYDALDRIQGLLGTVQERSEAAGETLAYSQSLMDNMRDILMTVSRRGNITQVNPAMEQISGYSAKELLGKRFANFFTDPERARAGIKQAIEEGEVSDYELILVTKDEREVPLSYNAAVLRGPRGGFRGILGTARDMTQTNKLINDLQATSEELEANYEELQATSEELEATNEEMQATMEELEAANTYRQSMMDAMMDVLMTTDREGIITEVNRATERISGYSRDELIGQPLRQFFTDPDRAQAGIEQVLKEKRVSDYELIVLTKDGREVPVSYNATVLRGARRRITGVLGSARDMSQVRRLIDEMEAASANRQSMMDAMMDILMTTDREGIITEVNRATERISGYSRDELIGQPLRQFFTDPDHAQAGIEQVQKERRVSDYELTMLTKYGRKVPMSYNATVLRGARGRITGVLGSARDMTSIKQAEEARLRLASIVESSDDAIIGKALDGTILSWNAGAERLYGYSAEEVQGRSIAILVPPDRSDDTSQLLEKIGRGEPVHNYETVRVRKDGGQIPVSVTVSPIRDAEGKITGASTIARDITERKRAEEALRRASAYHRSLIEASLDPLVIIGPDGKITDVNIATEAATGRLRDELVGTDFSDYFTEPEQARAGYQRAFKEGSVRDYPLEIRRGDGYVMPVVYNASVYRDEAGKVIGLFAAARDIADLRQAEGEVRAVNRDLETLLYVASHDLREPLRAIENFSRMVNDQYADQLDERGQDFLRRVVGGAERMTRLLDDITALSRVQRIEPPTEEVEGRIIVREALQRLEPKIKETGADVQIAEDLPQLRADKTWATEAVYNLVFNALKFTRDGVAPEVEIAPYQPAEGEPVGVGVVVRDRGPGVAPEHAERIFGLFERAVGREVEGTGAGLAIVRQIARRHGGWAWVRPREGGGSEFIITFGT
jgi:PAS domain S-box-containing protein